MKVLINRKPVEGPWGGGNKTLSHLVNELQKKHDVVYELQPDVDIIFCFDPRHDNAGIWYQNFIDFKIKNPKVKIIQRVGDVGSHSKPELKALLRQIVKLNFTDHFIFPSMWARKMINHKGENYSHIPNAPLKDFYKAREIKKNTLETSKVSIVTHHWSDNPKKGFAIYEKIGEVSKENNIVFHYYGRYSEKYKKAGINIHKPIDTKELISILPQYDFYVTASIEEAGANHVLEAMACGIPVFYHIDGGSIGEYCKDFGIPFRDANDLLEKINLCKNEYRKYYDKTLKYNDCIENVIERYIEIIERVNSEKN